VSELLLPSFFDVHRELTHQVALPIGRVNGQGCTTLKVVGNYLGIHWPPGTGWQEAWNVYQAWYHGDTRHYELLTPLVRYLWTDLDAVRQVWEWLGQIA
jgi:predicted RecB family nuclease